MEVGFITPFKHGNILVYMFLGMSCGWVTLYEWNSSPVALRKVVNHDFGKMNDPECRTPRSSEFYIAMENYF